MQDRLSSDADGYLARSISKMRDVYQVRLKMYLLHVCPCLSNAFRPLPIDCKSPDSRVRPYVTSRYVRGHDTHSNRHTVHNTSHLSLSQRLRQHDLECSDSSKDIGKIYLTVIVSVLPRCLPSKSMAL